MKTILLRTSAADNSGIRRDGGETLTIGSGDSEITLEGATALVEGHCAIDVSSSPTASLPEADTPPAKPAKKAD